jgi:hypothetical protein
MTSPTIRHCLILGAMTLFAALQARAEAQEPAWSVKGFGTLSAVSSSERHADFVTNRYQGEGAGGTRHVSIKPDSRFGVQFDAHLAERLDGVVQVVAQQQSNGVISPKVEWANLRYKLTPDWTVRAGRMALPVLMVSDYRLVGFSNLMVRPPLEAYAIIPNTSIDGFDTTWRTSIGPASNSLQFIFGKFFRRYPNSGSIDVPTSWGISDWLEVGPLSIHASYSYPKVTWQDPEAQRLFDGLNQFGDLLQSIPGLSAPGAQTKDLAKRYSLTNERISILTLGATFDQDPWTLSAEWVRMSHVGFLPTNTAYYVTAGYRLGPVTPYASYSKLRASEIAHVVSPTAGLPPPLSLPGEHLTTALQELLQEQIYAQRTLSAGFRWEIRSNFDLKLQVDQVKPAAGTKGLLLNLQPGYRPGARFHVVSLAVDFVF